VASSASRSSAPGLVAGDQVRVPGGAWRPLSVRVQSQSVLTLDGQTAIAIAGLATSAATGFGGIVLGSRLSRQTARDLAKDQREWTERHSVRQRQDEEAEKMNELLLDAATGMPTVVGPARETGQKMREVHGRILQAFARGLVLDDPEIRERVRALDMAMLIFSQQAELLATRQRPVVVGAPEPSINPWPISVAYGEVREALSCFARHIDPPEAKFPRAREVIELSTDDDGNEVGLDRIYLLLGERGAPPR
jgi:hypothetical protein